MYEVLKAKYVYTWEVVGDTTASSRDCFRGFNPTTHKAYEEEVQNWSSALLAMASEVAPAGVHACAGDPKSNRVSWVSTWQKLHA